jgi:hypothetical protein
MVRLLIYPFFLATYHIESGHERMIVGESSRWPNCLNLTRVRSSLAFTYPTSLLYERDSLSDATSPGLFVKVIALGATLHLSSSHLSSDGPSEIMCPITPLKTTPTSLLTDLDYTLLILIENPSGNVSIIVYLY